MDKKRKHAYLLLTMTTLVWGVATVVIKHTLSFIDPVSFLFWRFLIACWLFLPLFIYKFLQTPIKTRDFLKLGFFGALGTGVSLYFCFEGIDKTTAIDAVLIQVMSPILIVTGGVIFLKERLESHERFGLIIAFLGTLVTIIQPLLEKKEHVLVNIEGNFFVFLSAVFWAVYVLHAKNDFKKYSPFLVTSVAFFTGFLFIMLLYFSRKEIIIPSSNAWKGIIYMGGVSSVIAYLGYNKAVSLIEASEATLFSYLKPLVAVPLSFIVLGEEITFPFLIGAVLIGLGVGIAEFYNRN